MKKRIKDIADLRQGYQFRGKVESDPTGNVHVIQIKDVDANMQVRVDGLVSVTVDRPAPYLTQHGDVLFLSRGHRLYAAVVPDVFPNTIATGYFIILRLRIRDLLPEYLAWSMNQHDFQQSLRPFHRGSHVPMISRADVEELKVALPPLDVQRQILTLNELLNEEQRISATLQQRRTTLIEAVCTKLMCK